jgi:hypothetical protein
MTRTLIPLMVAGFVTILATAASTQEVDWTKVDSAFGRKAAVTGDVRRYGFPRTDLNVTLDGVTIKPALALGGWVAFKPMHGGAMVMGDLVLLETEINPVMAKMIENGLEPVREHVESNESFVIQGWRPDSAGGRRCGRTRTADVMTEADCVIRAI